MRCQLQSESTATKRSPASGPVIRNDPGRSWCVRGEVRPFHERHEVRHESSASDRLQLAVVCAQTFCGQRFRASGKSRTEKPPEELD